MSAVRWRKLRRSALLSAQLLAAHPLRTALSVSGLLVGVAAVTVMAAAGRGAEQRVVERVQALGTNMLTVSAAPAQRVAGRIRQVATTTLLRPADAVAIADEAPSAVAAAAAVNRGLVVRWEGRNTNTGVTGTTPAGLAIRNVRAAAGRVHDESEERERRRVAVLGPTVARVLFGTTDPVGLEIRVGATPFEVIGVTAPRGMDPGGADLDNVVFIPLETALRRVANVPYVDVLYVQARSSAHLDALEAEVRDILRARHRVRDGTTEPFVIRNQAVLLRTERAAARTLNSLTIGAAALALVVGGVGILAVMLMAIRERIHEIGLRRALGARRSDIQLQFLMESLMVSVAGGVAGVVLGLAVAGAAALLGPWDLAVSWVAVSAGLGLSLALGVGVGVVPATRAARLEPMGALRSE